MMAIAKTIMICGGEQIVIIVQTVVAEAIPVR